MSKHFNAGNVFGKITEVKEESSNGGKPYLQISVDVSGDKSGRVKAYCRMWGEQRINEFMNEWKRFPTEAYWFRGFLGQYTSKSGDVLSNFTVFNFERKADEKRAVFILKGVVSHHPSRTNDSGQRFLLDVTREGANGKEETESFELWSPGEKLLDPVNLGDLVEAKGLVRQKDVDGFYGGSEGPVRAYVDLLKIIPLDAVSDEDLPH
jgi:hypothetical protein